MKEEHMFACGLKEGKKLSQETISQQDKLLGEMAEILKEESKAEHDTTSPNYPVSLRTLKIDKILTRYRALRGE